MQEQSAQTRATDAAAPRTAPSDRARQALNLAGAIGQIAATAYVVSSGSVENFNQPAAGGDPPIIPAGYAFAVWGLIYAGSLAYALYQALPANRRRDSFRRAGWGSALAFAATTGWLLVAQRPALVWGTVALFAVVGAGLAVALRAFERDSDQLSRTDRLLTIAPMSVFLGWTSVALFANTAAALRFWGTTQPGGETALTIVMLVVAAFIAVAVTVATRGNTWYAGTVAWALIGIVVADVAGTTRPRNLPVATTAIAALVVLALAWRQGRRRPTSPHRPRAPRPSGVQRTTVDLAGFPDLVVIHLGMRVNALAGIRTVLGFGPRITGAVNQAPDGLLLHESFLISLLPPHVGMREYWRDFDALERWARSEPHRAWWQQFIRDSGGTGFWHETYSMRGGIEAIYDDMAVPVGLMRFAPLVPARGAMFSARRRLGGVDPDVASLPAARDAMAAHP